MPYQPAPGVVLAELRFELGGQRIENTLYFAAVEIITPATMLALGDNLLSWWEEFLAPNLSQDIGLTEVYLTDLTTETGSVVTATPTATIQGDIVGQSLPSSVALCVSFRTLLRGRSYRGRNYVAGLAEADVAINTVTTSRANAIRDAYVNLKLEGAIVDEWVWCIISRYHDGDLRPTAVQTAVQTAVVVDYTVDSQRRRLPGRGT